MYICMYVPMYKPYNYIHTFQKLLEKKIIQIGFNRQSLNLHKFRFNIIMRIIITYYKHLASGLPKNQTAHRKQCFFVSVRFILVWFCMINFTLRLRDVELYNRQNLWWSWEKLHDGTNFHSLYMPFGDSSGSLFCICGNSQSRHVHYTEFILSYGVHACRLGLI